MNTYTFTRAMIESAVAHGIRDMQEDPERSVRRLVDLGKQFSKNRFQDQVFTSMQELLDNENSAYYDMIANLLQNADPEAMKLFGVNFGYMGWSYGARRIRGEQEQLGFCVPWNIMLRYDGSADGLTASRIASLVTQGQQLGIYIYFIRQSASAKTPFEVLDLFVQNKECAFVWVRETGRLTAAEIQMLSSCKNAVVVLPVDDPESLLTTELLREKKILFALYGMYDDAPRDQLAAARTHQMVLTAQSAMFFLISKDNTSEETCKATRQHCYDSRLRQDLPYVLMDYYGDAEALAGVTVEHRLLLEIGADGSVLRPANKKGASFGFDKPLPDALREMMPSK